MEECKMVTNESDSFKETPTIKQGSKNKSGFWSKFSAFIAMGGFIVIIVIGWLIAIGINLLINSYRGGS
jgi:hypothetical protein